MPHPWRNANIKNNTQSKKKPLSAARQTRATEERDREEIVKNAAPGTVDGDKQIPIQPASSSVRTFTDLLDFPEMQLAEVVSSLSKVPLESIASLTLAFWRNGIHIAQAFQDSYDLLDLIEKQRPDLGDAANVPIEALASLLVVNSAQSKALPVPPSAAEVRSAFMILEAAAEMRRWLETGGSYLYYFEQKEWIRNLPDKLPSLDDYEGVHENVPLKFARKDLFDKNTEGRDRTKRLITVAEKMATFRPVEAEEIADRRKNKSADWAKLPGSDEAKCTYLRWKAEGIPWQDYYYYVKLFLNELHKEKLHTDAVKRGERTQSLKKEKEEMQKTASNAAKLKKV